VLRLGESWVAAGKLSTKAVSLSLKRISEILQQYCDYSCLES
jgi:hypothetical protein